MQVYDAQRLLGARPTGIEYGTIGELLEDLDRLAIDGAAVTPNWMLDGDPRVATEYDAARGRSITEDVEAAGGRLTLVPVVIPAPPGVGWPPSPDDVDAPVVRACPVRHRFELLGPTATDWWHTFAQRGVAVAIDAAEVGIQPVARLVAAVPGLRVLMLSPGYRELRRLVEVLEHAPGLRVETGTLVAAGAVEWLARRVGAHRLVFGTGAPVWDAAGPRFLLDHLDLPAADIQRIAHGSWLQFVGGRG